MPFVIPVQIAYDGKSYVSPMGPFSHSAEREFALTVNRRAIDECTNINELRLVTKNLLEGWASMNTALQSLVLENIQLRQALDKRDVDLQAAEEIVNEASATLEIMQAVIARNEQSKSAKRGLWPWQK